MQKDAKWVESDLNAVLKTWSFSVFHRIRGDLIILMVYLRFEILKFKKKSPNVLWKADTCFISVYSELFFLVVWKIKYSPNTEFISYFLKYGEAHIYGKSTENRHDEMDRIRNKYFMLPYILKSFSGFFECNKMKKKINCQPWQLRKNEDHAEYLNVILDFQHLGPKSWIIPPPLSTGCQLPSVIQEGFILSCENSCFY